MYCISGKKTDLADPNENILARSCLVARKRNPLKQAYVSGD
jgi:hypothetical protein